METEKIYKHIAELLYFWCLWGTSECYLRYDSEFNKHLLVKSPPYSDRIVKTMEELESQGETVAINTVIKRLWSKQRNDCEREVAHIKSLLKETTELIPVVNLNHI